MVLPNRRGRTSIALLTERPAYPVFRATALRARRIFNVFVMIRMVLANFAYGIDKATVIFNAGRASTHREHMPRTCDTLTGPTYNKVSSMYACTPRGVHTKRLSNDGHGIEPTWLRNHSRLPLANCTSDMFIHYSFDRDSMQICHPQSRNPWADTRNEHNGSKRRIQHGWHRNH